MKKGLSETQTFYYILLFVGFSVIGIEFMGYFPYEDPNAWDYFKSGLNLAIPIIGTIAAYRANGGAKGKAFAAKYFSISFVVLMRFTIYLIPIVVGLLIYYGASIDWSTLEDDVSFQTGWFEVVLLSAWYVALYFAVVKHIGDTVKPSPTSQRSRSVSLKTSVAKQKIVD